MIIRSADSQGLLLHTPKPMLSGIPTPAHTISYAVQNHQTLEQFLESLYVQPPWFFADTTVHKKFWQHSTASAVCFCWRASKSVTICGRDILFSIVHLSPLSPDSLYTFTISIMFFSDTFDTSCGNFSFSFTSYMDAFLLRQYYSLSSDP